MKKNSFKLVDNNYQIYFSILEDLINKNFRDKSEINILDFGCGSGKMLSLLDELSYKKELSKTKISFFGVDVFKNKNSLEKTRKLARNAFIKSINPYEDFDFGVKFDIVISNQVFEHINYLEKIYAHLRLILNNNGLIIAGFPTKEIIIEPHLKIPFIHYIKKETKILFYFLSVFSLLKIGQFNRKFKKKEDRISFIKNRYNYCNTSIHYINYKEHVQILRKYFKKNVDISEIFLFSFKNKRKLSNYIKFMLALIPNKNIRLLLMRLVFGTYMIIHK